jgi:hypothetical protein
MVLGGRVEVMRCHAVVVRYAYFVPIELNGGHEVIFC